MSKMKTTCHSKDVFMYIVKYHLYEHPEWMEEVIKVASDTVLQKIKDERNVSVDIQYALAMLKEKQYSKLNKEGKYKVLKAILDCDVFEGTPFAKEIKSKLKKLEE